jgi:ribonuclease HI
MLHCIAKGRESVAKDCACYCPLSESSDTMNSPQNHYFLLAEARLAADSPSKVLWHFLLESSDGATRLDVAEEEPETPSDRLELLALVRGLEAIDQPARVTVLTPSRYVSHGLRFGLDNWRENGWHWESFGQMTPIKNVDLWQRIDQALTIHRVEHKTVRLDAPQAEVPAPHEKPTRPTRRSQRMDKVQLPAARRGLWQSMRSGVSGLLVGLGEYVAPSTLSSPQGS